MIGVSEQTKLPRENLGTFTTFMGSSRTWCHRGFRTDEITPHHQKRPEFRGLFRLAQISPNSKDLVDDMYQVLNASYCAVYATAEPGQAEYASLLLTDMTQVAIY
jgi:hypothetical protein